MNAIMKEFQGELFDIFMESQANLIAIRGLWDRIDKLYGVNDMNYTEKEKLLKEIQDTIDYLELPYDVEELFEKENEKEYIIKGNIDKGFESEVDGVYDEIKPSKEAKEVIDAYRLRRITGYLTDDYRQWNDAKQSELKDRVKHAR